jgi:hypothetical protein
MTTDEIYNQIIEEKGNYQYLDDLNSTSHTSVWRQLVYLFAFFSNAIHQLFSDFKTTIETIFAQNQPGTLQWWIAKLKAFQYGDTLEFIDGVFKYALIDVEKQIVTQAAVEVENQVLILKVAKTVDGQLTPLEAAEITALQAYINQIKFPGTFTQVVSQPADFLKLNYRIYYDAMLDKSEIETLIIAATDNYIQQIVFNGKFVVSELTDQIQAIAGIEDAVFIDGVWRNALLSDFDYQPIEDYVYSKAGYFTVVQLNLTFIANV